MRATAFLLREGSSLPWGKDGSEPSLLSSHTLKFPVGPIPHKRGNATGSQAHCVPHCPRGVELQMGTFTCTARPDLHALSRALH